MPVSEEIKEDGSGLRKRGVAQEEVAEGKEVKTDDVKVTKEPEKRAEPARKRWRYFAKRDKSDLFFNTFFACVYLLAVCSFISTHWNSIEITTSRHVTLFLFHRFLGCVFIIAFISNWVQIIGLCGENGILPIKDTMAALENLKKSKKWSFPTIFWFLNATDDVIKRVCLVGLASSICYTLNIVPTLSLTVSWTLFLSFKVVGREFFALQFDNLILDTGFLAFFLPPFRFLPFLTVPTTEFQIRSFVWIMGWLGFRLMVGSGLCKIMSGDVTWRNGTALCYHYWSQPMPNWISFYAHHLPPLWFQKMCCYYHFFVELVAPFGLFFPSIALPTFLLLSSLQIGIIITGNYGFFNILSILIPFLTLTDNCYPQFLQNALSVFIELPTITSSFALSLIWNIFSIGFVGAVMALSVLPFAQAARGHLYVPVWLAKIHNKVSPFGILNYYGLFAKMTTSRRDIVIEGSNGDDEWQEYEFRYKVDNPSKFPRFVVGHLPRLDWRMWFCQFQQFNPLYPTWYDELLTKLLHGTPEVLDLLAKNPFPDKPPKYIRSMIYDYQLATPEEHKKDGNWWVRSHKKLWWPPVGLDKSGKMGYVLKSTFLS